MEQNLQTSKVISVKEWVINLVIMCIPIVNIIMLFMWAFSKTDINENKKNWAKATLILMAIIVALNILIYTLLAIFGVAMLNSNGHI